MSTPEYLSKSLRLTNGTLIRNRIVKSAMSEVMADPETGAPKESLFRLYQRWAKSGAAILISGNVIIDRNGRTELGNVLIENDSHLPLLRRWAEVAQSEGAALWMQINHAGRQTAKKVTQAPVSASSVPLKGFMGMFQKPRPLSEEEIENLITRFANAAFLAKEAGFSGVQIHAAHGYLVNQFLSPKTNQRTDRWGGDLEGRMRFLLSIIRAVREKVGPEFPIGVKLNSADFQRGGFEEDDSILVVKALEQEKIDLLEISGGNYEKPAMMGKVQKQAESTKQREAYFLDYAKKIREHTQTPLLLTGGMRSVQVMEDVLKGRSVDAVGLARPMALEPDLPTKLLSGKVPGAKPVDLRIGIRLLDGALQLAWAQEQFQLMAKGLEPNPNLNLWKTAVGGILKNFSYNPFRSSKQSGT